MIYYTSFLIDLDMSSRFFTEKPHMSKGTVPPMPPLTREGSVHASLAKEGEARPSWVRWLHVEASTDDYFLHDMTYQF